jgi:hypothetical protein
MPGEIPRGLADLKVYPITGVSTVGASVDVPGIRSLAFNIDSTSDELEGDNSIIAKSPGPKSLSGSMEFGRINLAALAVIFGGTVGSTGVTPNIITALDHADTVAFRFFQIVGQAPDAETSAGAYRVTIYKANATSGLDETLETNAWNTPSVNFEGIAISGNLIKRQQYETSIAIT